MRFYRSVSAIILTALIIGIVPIGILNFIVDPYVIFNAVYLPDLNRYRPEAVDRNGRMKAVRIIQETPEAIVLGSSLVDNMLVTRGSAIQPYAGINPNENELAAFLPKNSLNYFNAAVRAGSMFEHHQFFKHAALNNPDLKHVILGLAIITFLPDAPTAANPNIHVSDIAGKTYVPPTVYLRNLFDWRIFNTSLDVIALNNPELAIWINQYRERLTQIKSQVIATPEKILEIAKSALRTIDNARRISDPAPSSKPKAATADPTLPTTSDVQHLGTRTSPKPPVTLVPWNEGFSYFMEDVEREKRYLSYICYTDYVFGDFNPMFTNGTPRPLTKESFQRLREMVDHAKIGGFKFDIFLTAHHNALWYRLYKTKRGRPFITEWLNGLVEILPIWDLSGALEDVADPSPYFDQEPLHMIRAAGEVGIPLIVKGEEQPGLIKRIHKKNVDSHLAKHYARIMKWGESNKGFKNIYDATPEFLAPTGANFCYPKVMKDQENNIVVLHLYGKYYARRMNGAQIQIKNVLNNTDDNVIRSDSLEGIKDLIARELLH